MIKNPLLKWDEVKMRIEKAVLKYVGSLNKKKRPSRITE
jgi:hypothetical protein